MNYTIDTSARTPAYLQLYTQLKEDITAEVYAFGARLPSKRTIAAETGVSVITVMHALDLLSEEGYIELKERSGAFVIFRPGDFRGYESAGSSLEIGTGIGLKIGTETGSKNRETYLPPAASGNTSANVSVNAPGSASANASGSASGNAPASIPSYNMGDFPHSVLARTVRRVLADYGEQVLVRSPNQGCLVLREELCAYLARSRSIHATPSQIVVGAGAEYLYGLIAQLFGRETKVALEDPSYTRIREVYTSFGLETELLPLNADGIDPEALKAAKAAVLHTTPFHNFPTGITASASKKHEYLRFAAERQAVIVEDNYDSELTVSEKPEDSLFAMAKGRNVIYVNTFSRTIAPSVRIGYMVLPEDLVETFQQKLGFYSCTVPVLDQFVIAELLKSGDFERHINRVRRRKRKEAEKPRESV